MGYVTLGIFTIQQQGIEACIIQMISHGLVSALLCVGVVGDRMCSRLITYGGIVKYSQDLILFMLFTLALEIARTMFCQRVFNFNGCF